VGWEFSGSLLARARNRVGYAIADHLVAPIQAVLNKYRESWNLPRVARPDDTFSRTGTIAQLPREFDFPREQLPRAFHYVGPWFDRDSSAGVTFPYERLDGRPMIYGSIGTLQSANSGYFGVMAEACNGLDVQLVLALGGSGGNDLPDFPGKPIVVNYAPQLELLARAAATITHAGMNTTLQSLCFGVPMVAIPLAHDQPAIAARLTRIRAGIVIPPARLTASKLRAAIQTLLSPGSKQRVNAHCQREAIRKSGGVERAADIAERLIAVRTETGSP
jgi:MGT family glycosyltransferase